jgi:hypothetical protein
VNAVYPSWRQILAAKGAILMGGSIRTTVAAGADWVPISPSEAGFTSDLGARLDNAITEKRVWNLHGVVIVRNWRSGAGALFRGR